MDSRKVQIIITYRGAYNALNGMTLATAPLITTVIMYERDVAELLPRIINADVEKVEVEEYNG